jgi:hypothetical protein
MKSTNLLSAAMLVLILVLRILTSIKAMFTKRNGIALGPALEIPIMTTDDSENFKDKFKYIILVIAVFLGIVKTVSTITDIGLYIVGVFNTTAVKIPPSNNYVSTVASTTGSIIQILVVVLIIVALLYVIRFLLKPTDSF